MILIAGGDADPNLEHLMRCSKLMGIDSYQLLVGENNHPSVVWDLSKQVLTIDDQPLEVCGAFIRYDVFSGITSQNPKADYRASAWYTTIMGWLMAKENIKIFNRFYADRITNKPYVLYLAEQLGLNIPITLISNDLKELIHLQSKNKMVAKPVNGGGHCRYLEELLKSTEQKSGRAASPAIIQSTLVPPEIRVFGVHGNFFVFTVIADALDYRTVLHCEVKELPIESVPDVLLDGLQRLMSKMEVDFCAADFKACPDTGKLLFLELNSSPMFIKFDEACNGRLSKTMIQCLETKK